MRIFFYFEEKNTILYRCTNYTINTRFYIKTKQESGFVFGKN